MTGSPIPCVGAIVHDGQGRILLVRRRNDPGRGQWSIPGGRVEPGETDADAVVREVAEETGLSVVVGALVGTVNRAAPGGATYLIRDYRAEVRGEGEPSAGDDASAVGWFTPGALASVDCVSGLVEALTAWGALPGGTSTIGQ